MHSICTSDWILQAVVCPGKNNKMSWRCIELDYNAERYSCKPQVQEANKDGVLPGTQFAITSGISVPRFSWAHCEVLTETDPQPHVAGCRCEICATNRPGWINANCSTRLQLKSPHERRWNHLTITFMRKVLWKGWIVVCLKTRFRNIFFLVRLGFYTNILGQGPIPGRYPDASRTSSAELSRSVTVLNGVEIKPKIKLSLLLNTEPRL